MEQRSTLSELWNEAFEAGEREMDRSLCRAVYTLNTWTDAKKAEVRKFLEDGYFVYMGSDCIGHTLAHMVEMAGIRWVVEEYGNSVMIRKRKGWGDYFVALR